MTAELWISPVTCCPRVPYFLIHSSIPTTTGISDRNRTSGCTTLRYTIYCINENVYKNGSRDSSLGLSRHDSWKFNETPTTKTGAPECTDVYLNKRRLNWYIQSHRKRTLKVSETTISTRRAFSWQPVCGEKSTGGDIRGTHIPIRHSRGHGKGEVSTLSFFVVSVLPCSPLISIG